MSAKTGTYYIAPFYIAPRKCVKVVMESDDQSLDPFIVTCLYIQFFHPKLSLKVEQHAMVLLIIITRA